MTELENWPVVVTNRCADACAGALGLGDREQTRYWLLGLIAERGTLVDRLPAPLAGRRSPSGYFLLVPDALALPLAAARDGEQKWIATHCLVFPSYRDTVRGTAPSADPFALTGRALLAQLNVLPHAIERFQQRCGGDAIPERARAELLHRIAPTVRAARRPPAWCGTRPADFYLIAGRHEEYCLPCRVGSGAQSFDVITCIHRAGDLFGLDATQLRAHCRVDAATFPPGSHLETLLQAGFRGGGRLRWRKPAWARPNPAATWWVVFTNHTAAAVVWQPDDEDVPLIVVGFADHRHWLVRFFDRLRRRNAAAI